MRSKIWKLTTVHADDSTRNQAALWLNKPDIFDLSDCGLGAKSIRELQATGRSVYGVVNWWLEEVDIGDGSDPNHEKWWEFQRYVDAITYKPGWYLRTGIEQGGPDGSRMWVQVGVTEEAEISWDVIEKKKTPWRGGKHYLSAHMCRNEVVGLIHHALVRAEMHEVNEWFRYKGRAIYNPHLDPDALIETAALAKNFNTRENAMTMEEST